MIIDPIEEATPTYRLDGEALQIAKELHEYSLQCEKEELEIEKQVQEFQDALMEEFDEKHSKPFQTFFERLAKSLAISVDEILTFELDATYLSDHNIAFMKQFTIRELEEIREEGEL